MDRLNQLRGEAGPSRDSTLDTSSPPSEAFMSANESSSKYFSLSEVDSTFDISPMKDVSLVASAEEAERSEPDRLISNLSPIGKKNDFLDSYKIGKQIEAANILSGGVDIFDDNDNSYDGDELVIDDNALTDDKGNTDLKITEAELKDDITEDTLVKEPVPSKETEVTLKIDGMNVAAIDVGNGLYLFQREVQGNSYLAALQIYEDQLPPFKIFNVQENADGKLDLYEEIVENRAEIPEEPPATESNASDPDKSCLPVKDSNVGDSGHKVDNNSNTEIENAPVYENQLDKELSKEQSDSKSDVNGKLKKFNESRKSPVVGNFTPMTFHSTPNKEGIPLTKTMVDLQLRSSRHSDNVKKTIEVHTDSLKQKIEPQRNLMKDFADDRNKQPMITNKTDMDEKVSIIKEESNNQDIKNRVKEINVNAEPVAQEITISKDKVEEIKESVAKSKSDVHVTEEIITEIQVSKENTDKINVANLLQPDKIEIENVETNKEITIDYEKKDASTTDINKIETVDSSSDKINNVNPKDNTKEKENIKDETKKSNFLNVDSAKRLDIEGDKDREVCKSNTDNNSDNKLTQPSTNTSNRIDQEESKEVEASTENVKNRDDTTIVNKIIDIHSNINISVGDVAKTEVLPLLEKVDTVQKVPESDSKGSKEVSIKNVLQKCTEDIKAKEDKSGVMDRTIREKIETAKEIVTQVLDTSIKEVGSIVVPPTLEDKKTKTNEILVNVIKETSKRSDNDKEKSLEEKHVSQIDTSAALKTNEVSNIKKDLTERINIPKTEIVKKIDTADMKKIRDVGIASKETSKIDTTKTEILESSQTTKNEINQHELLTKTNKQPTAVAGAERKDISNKYTPKIEATSIIMPGVTETKAELVMHVENKNTKNKEPKPVVEKVQNKDSTDKRNIKVSSIIDVKPTSNAPVPFGKWTEVNRQAFLIKIKETKIPSNSSNGKQIKNSNDLNRRDFLKKIDTQRPIASNTTTTKIQDFGSGNRLAVKKEASVFSTTKPATQESKPPIKSEAIVPKASGIKKTPKPENIPQPVVNTNTPIAVSDAVSKKEPSQRKEINNQDLIDKTIEGIINRAVPSKPHEDVKETVQSSPNVESETAKQGQPVGLDEIEMKMNELHGIPFIERPAHELPRVNKPGIKTYSKAESQKTSSISRQNNVPNLIPFVTKNQKGVKENIIEVDSEEDVIEHEPITGDMEVSNKIIAKPPGIEKSETITQITSDIAKKESIITEKDFDKFARRNSISYENRITVNFDSAKSPNVINTVVQTDSVLKSYPIHDKSESNTKSLASDIRKQNSISNPTQNFNKSSRPRSEINSNKNYQSKVKMAYQTVMTAKHQQERPITIIEDKPVKVVYMDSNAEYIPKQLNAQGKELSPAKKQTINVDLIATNDSLDSDILEIEDGKVIEDIKIKSKHQRKQVLTPVEIPDLELIEPSDLGIEVSPKKRRKIEEKVEKSPRPVVPKKTYLLGRETVKDDTTTTKSLEISQVFNKDSLNPEKSSPHKDTASAIDNLVKAAELLETQSGNIINKSSSEIQNSDSQQNTPVKRGRGRPRKYPLPDGAPSPKTKTQPSPSPQKKPRLAETKPVKNQETDEDSSDDGELIKENWTMGKINENIVCPICNKLFRSENVVFKHVKHCTGPSPNRSESGNKSPRRFRGSQDVDTKSDDMDPEDDEPLQKAVLRKRKSRDTNPKLVGNDKSEVIVIEDTPVKPKPDKREESNPVESKKSIMNKSKFNNLVCEFCGKTFRQLSYLVNHKMQHEKEDIKRVKTEEKSLKSVFSCEVCKKEFRKLHHLVQHRIIHNLNNPISAKRKNSSEQNENKILKETVTKQTDDASAGFRCEPCDKSFRKLHHLVEHRETHDGINRQKSTTATTVQTPVEKPPTPPQCDICKKTFRKLHHLIEHKEQHLETSSEKSDDKSIKSSLSTKDIIHECSLCYMVFPNEHSLNKHSIICQRKKRQSATKQPNQTEQTDSTEEDNPPLKTDDDLEKDEVVIITSEVKENKTEVMQIQEEDKPNKSENESIVHIKENAIDLPKESPKICNIDNAKEINNEHKQKYTETKTHKDVILAPQNVNKVEETDPKVIDTSKEYIKKAKKTPLKDKVAPTVTKRQKLNQPLVTADEVDKTELSDDEDVRYMLNPDYKSDNTIEVKTFMKVRANKRNSLQIERPNSKDLVKRRISLQHPPKIPRLKQKSVSNSAPTVNKNIKPIKLEPVPSTDSDDSDVKYSFPKTSDKITKTVTEEPQTEPEKKKPRKSLAEKNKLLTGIAKRKSLGKTMSPKNKVKPIPVKRIAEIEHRCDCGQLFSSAALLSRHTTLAHTPPRIRRRRSPPPDNKPVTKTLPRKISTTSKSKPNEQKSLSVKHESLNENSKSPASRKSKVQKSDVKHTDARKTLKSNENVDAAKRNLKIRRTAAHKGVPVPEKMRKYMENLKK